MVRYKGMFLPDQDLASLMDCLSSFVKALPSRHHPYYKTVRFRIVICDLDYNVNQAEVRISFSPFFHKFKLILNNLLVLNLQRNKDVLAAALDLLFAHFSIKKKCRAC